MEEDEALWSDFVKEGPDVEVYTSSVILLGALQQNAWTLLVRKILSPPRSLVLAHVLFWSA